MESVLHTLIIILFILIPGFIFRRVYFQGGFSKQFDSKSWSHSIFYSILFGLIIEIISLCIFGSFIERIQGNSIVEFYQCISENQIPLWIFDIIILKNLLWFFIILFATSYTLAQFFYHLVRRLKLDRKLLFLRFNNHWHYYFTGEIKDFQEFKHINGKFQCSHVDVLVNTEDGDNRLYTGFLSSHTINSNTGDLEAIYLTIPRRYKKGKDNEQGGWKDIKSDVLIIPYSKVINLNIRFTFEEKRPFNFPTESILSTVTTLLFFSASIFIWWDYYDLLSNYNWISNFVIKTLLQLTLLFAFTTIFALIKTIIAKDEDEKKKQRESTLSVGCFFIFLIFIISIIYYCTY